YVPDDYSRDNPTPLVIWLHGGVSRDEFVGEDAEDEWSKHPMVELAAKEGWIVLLPLARKDCLWWNETGMDHLNWLIRETKRKFNIDDNRVVACGFSDGGSGSYHLAMMNPTDFSLFFPWSGHVVVSSWSGGMEVYPANLSARPLFPVNGGRDGLYPAGKLMPMMNFLMEYVSSDLSYTAYDTASHNPGYLSAELPLFSERVKAIARRPLRSKIFWQCSDMKYGKLDWLEITEIDTTPVPDEEWQQDLNFMQVEDRITIGFMADREFEGVGVRAESVVEDTNSVAFKMGMLTGDIVVALDDIPVNNSRDLGAAKSTKERGDSISITVLRNEEEFTLTTILPPAVEYDAFPHKSPYGSVDGYRVGNSFHFGTYRVKDFSIYIHPDMVRLDQPVKVHVNGRILFDDIIKPDSRLLLDSFLKNHDRQLLWVGRIDIRL
ncbi:MAG: PDZ domain-containing protein, partial [Calditrichaeota bacterium]|nr:PDZ domain-containing protein [Calditrichota bacterium]